MVLSLIEVFHPLLERFCGIWVSGSNHHDQHLEGQKIVTTQTIANPISRSSAG